MNQTLEKLLIARSEVQLLTAEKTLARVHDAHNHALPIHHGKNRHTHIDRTIAGAIANLSVLRSVALRRVDARHHLQTRDDDGSKLRRKPNRTFAQHTVHAHADTKPPVYRLKVDIRCLLRERRIQNGIDKGNDLTAARLFVGRTAAQFADSISNEALYFLPLHTPHILPSSSFP